jgi:hypothetical protein
LETTPSVDFKDGRTVVFRGLNRRGVCLLHAFGIRRPAEESRLIIAHQWHDVRTRGARNISARCGSAVYGYDPAQPEEATIEYRTDTTDHLYSDEAGVGIALGDFAVHFRSPAFDPTINQQTLRGLTDLHQGSHPFTDELIVAGIGQLGIAAAPQVPPIPQQRQPS